jgi:hypothetical protein
MTLAERRVVHDFETGQFAAYKTRVEEAVGFPVPVEVLWETLATPGDWRLYAESWPQIYFEPLIAGLQVVCRDEMGREAIKSGLKKIIIQNVKGCTYGDCWSSFADGVLTLDHDSTANAGDVEQRKKGLVEMLESTLS